MPSLPGEDFRARRGTIHNMKSLDSSKIIVFGGIDTLLTSPYNNGMINEIELPTLKCLRCGHEWIPRQPKKPKYCARCNSPYWNKPKWKGVKKP